MVNDPSRPQNTAHIHTNKNKASIDEGACFPDAHSGKTRESEKRLRIFFRADDRATGALNHRKDRPRGARFLNDHAEKNRSGESNCL